MSHKNDAIRRYPDQTPRSAASELGLHCLSMSHKNDAILIRVKVQVCMCEYEGHFFMLLESGCISINIEFTVS